MGSASCGRTAGEGELGRRLRGASCGRSRVGAAAEAEAFLCPKANPRRRRCREPPWFRLRRSASPVGVGVWALNLIGPQPNYFHGLDVICTGPEIKQLHSIQGARNLFFSSSFETSHSRAQLINGICIHPIFSLEKEKKTGMRLMIR